MSEHLEIIDQAKNTIVDLAIQFGPKVVVAIIIIVIGVYVGRWIGNLSNKGLEKLGLEPPVQSLLVRIVRLIVLGLFVIMALQNLGIQLLPLIAGLGVAGAGIALAMQGVLGNIMAGLTIIFTKPFRVGEYISIGDEEGQVENISLFSTTLGHYDLSQVVIPNRKIVGEILHNFGEIRQLDIRVGVAHDTDLNLATSIVNQILQKNERVLESPEPIVITNKLTTSAIELSVRPWIRVPDYIYAKGEITKSIVESFRQNGIVIPRSQHEVRILDEHSHA
jgi:small conductance mechanosensitive channel